MSVVVSHCHHCGYLLEPDCDFCPNCGTPTERQEVAQARVISAVPVQYLPAQPAYPETPPPPVAIPQSYALQTVVPAPIYAYQPLARRPVNTGVCVLVSFLWTGAGFFFIPDRVPLGLVLVLCTAVMAVFIIFGTGLTGGVGACCAVPIGFAWWFGILMWTYKDAERYNRGL